MSRPDLPYDPGLSDSRWNLRRALSASGHRCTEQRLAVHDALWEMRTHPTADELYRAVRRRIPDVSLATVYNAVELFAAAGICLKLRQADGVARFDIRTEDHHHLECVDCGRLVDVDGPPLYDLLARVRSDDGFELLGGRLVLEGRCGRCLSADARSPANAAGSLT